MSDPKVILITGCSSGFGLLTAARLASKGHHVVATMRNPDKSGALFQEVRTRGGNVDILPLDVTDKASVARAVKDIAAKYGYIDVVVNNAGYGIGGFFEDLTDGEIRQQFETNFFGVQNVIREVIPCMRQKKSGKIINFQRAGLSASPCFGAYNASKWALEGFSESLRAELKFWGIDVLWSSGTYKTKFFMKTPVTQKNFNNPVSPYYPISQFLERRVKDSVDDCFKDPEDIAILIEKLIDAKNPRFATFSDIETQVMYALRKSSFRLYSWLIRKVCSAVSVAGVISQREAHRAKREAKNAL